MFRATSRRLAQQAYSTSSKAAPLTIHNNPYRARKVWPPDFSQLTPQQQLRLEKKHKRRVALAGYSPKWDKGVRLVRALSIIGMRTPVESWTKLTATACVLIMTFGAEYRFWGGEYVYKPTEEVGFLGARQSFPNECRSSHASDVSLASWTPTRSTESTRMCPKRGKRSRRRSHKLVQNCIPRR